MADNTPKSPIIEFGFGEGDDGLPPSKQSYDDFVTECRRAWPTQKVHGQSVLDDGWVLGGVLLCPVCGGNNLHQGEVRIYHRDKEDGPGTLTVADTGKVSTERLEDKDIPGRRDSLSIGFWCESMCRLVSLHISQHKGSTYMQWVADGLDEDAGPVDGVKVTRRRNL